MSIRKSIELIQRVDQLMRTKAARTIQSLSEKLGISERQAYRVVGEMKDLGLPIDYDKKEKTYYYKSEVFMKFEITVVDGKEKRNILGGEKINFDNLKNILHTDIFWQYRYFTLY